MHPEILENSSASGIKSKQIDQLTVSLQNTTDSLKSAQALHAGTIKQQLSDKTQTTNETDKIEIKKHIWKFWKR